MDDVPINDSENSRLAPVQRQVRREIDAKLVIIRVLINAHQYWGEQVEAWRKTSAFADVDTEIAEQDCLAVQTEVERLVESLRAEIEERNV